MVLKTLPKTFWFQWNCRWFQWYWQTIETVSLKPVKTAVAKISLVEYHLYRKVRYRRQGKIPLHTKKCYLIMLNKNLNTWKSWFRIEFAKITTETNALQKWFQCQKRTSLPNFWYNYGLCLPKFPLFDLPLVWNI